MINTPNGNVTAPYIQSKGVRQNLRYANGAQQGWLTSSEQAQLQDHSRNDD